MRDVGSIPGWGRSPGDGNGNPLQYSCLGNPMDRCHSLWGCKESDTTEHTHKSISMAGLQMRNWGSHYGEPGIYLPRCLGLTPRTVPMSPAAPHASPVWFLAGPREGCSEGHWQNNCGQLALEKGLILLSKLFISSSRSRQLPAPWKRNTGLFTGKVWAPLWNSFYPCVWLHMPAPSETMVSAVLLIGLAFCQAVSRRTGRNVTPPPLPPAGFLVSARY